MSEIEKKEIKRTITDEDLRAAYRLRQIWNLKRRDLKLTQGRFADELERRGITGWNQSLVARYLGGYNALNRNAVLLFAERLGVQPDEIYPELFKDLHVQVMDKEFFGIWTQLTDDQKKSIITMAKSFLKED